MALSRFKAALFLFFALAVACSAADVTSPASSMLSTLSLADLDDRLQVTSRPVARSSIHVGPSS